MIEILTGFISGIVSGTGMGGGTILILCLSIFLGINQKIAQATNLIFFIPTSIAAIYVNIKKKKIDFKESMIKGYKEMGQINLSLAELGMTNEVSSQDNIEEKIAQGEY